MGGLLKLGNGGGTGGGKFGNEARRGSPTGVRRTFDDRLRVLLLPFGIIYSIIIFKNNVYIIIMKHPVFVGAFATLYAFGTFLIYKDLSIKHKYIAIKYFGH
jgi:hypothetical protein